MALAIGATATVAAETKPLNSWDSPASVAATVHRMAPSYGLDPTLVTAIILAESNFEPGAVSRKNAMGLMQLTKETAARFGVSDPFDPAQNLRGGMSYLRWLFDRYKGDLTLTLAAYNAGEAAVEQYGGVPPYAETKAYVQHVRQYYSEGGDAILARHAATASLLPRVYRGIVEEGSAPKAESSAPSVERTRSGVLIFRGPGRS
ncbi:MAG TPA: lytic transglycosylase domain-containing protein [Stellaceae bacterium]|nr:lytic transglycosylase domain-containing protein [Stellaceae bacterium]